MEGLLEKVSKSKKVISEVTGKFDHQKIGVIFSGDKDSTMLLHLIRDVCGGRVPFRVIKIGTTVEFPEVTAFTEKMRKLWHLDLYSFSNEIVARCLVAGEDRDICCQRLKTEPLETAVKSLGLDVLITSVRDDGNEGAYLLKWSDSQRASIHPMLHFEEKDVSDYIEELHVPLCSLYRKGYRSLDCIPCTALPEDKNEAVSEDMEEIKANLRSLGYL
ncbi:MAG: phosphoadenosine phosphosulfate reductase family protein [Nitrospirae bacterium]|nr:phosphoadenosine phosphosulfate reductase family protein [Nitrospirota bacterium]